MTWWRPAALLLAAGLVATGCTGGDDAVDVNNGGQFRFVEATPKGDLLGSGDRDSAPTFGGTLLDGTEFDSASLAGSVAVLNFWGQWCAPCRTEAPEFQEVYDDVRDRGVQFLGINVKDEIQLARAFVDDEGITFPSLFDPRGEVALVFRDFPPQSTPSTILLTPDGDVAAVYVGVVQAEQLRAAIDSLLAEA